MTIEKAPNARKYEVGTAVDFNRVYRSFNDGEIMEIDGGPTPLELQSMIRNDAQARQLSRALKLPIRAAKWEIIAGEGDKGEKDFIDYVLHASASEGGMTTPFRSVLAKMANAIVYRYAPFEKVWKLQDRGKYAGKVVLHKLAYRPPTTCTLLADKNGSFDGFRQRAYKDDKYTDVIFKPNRSLVFVHDEAENPLIGSTPFDTVYANYLHKRKVSFFYYAFLENVAFPRTLVRVANDDPDELQHLLDKARSLGSQGIIGLYEHESVDSYESARTTRDYQAALEYLDWQMSKACMAQFLDLGTSGERGSYALSQDKTAFFFNAMEAVLEDIADAVNNYLIADLIKYNFGPGAVFPKIRFQPLNDENAEMIMDLYKQITIAQSPNVTPPFLLKLIERVSEITGLDIDPLAEFDEKAVQEIAETIPTAADHLRSKESRAGSGQNAITGQDRNNNNKTPQSDEPGRPGQNRSDDTSIDKAAIPAAPRTPSRRRRDR